MTALLLQLSRRSKLCPQKALRFGGLSAFCTDALSSRRQARNPCPPYPQSTVDYNFDANMLRQWTNYSLIEENAGKFYDADEQLLPTSQSIAFPKVRCSNLSGQTVNLPSNIDAKVKMIVLSFRAFGFSQLRSWLDPFVSRYLTSSPSSSGNNPREFVAMEICFIEYSILSIAKGMYTASIRNAVSPSQRDYTFLSFGDTLTIASKLFLPHSCIGYAYLLDRQNRIRWRGCGTATDSEVQTMLALAKSLSEEQK